ncbi:hypothetical protein K431DRAFT_299124 [Polychaeton citri CBS 116435]|uniref:Uncharacterized protein n=1 Tax=Polychaeton citri CBS 116435 TaxID=1314669 RepID=A0A9P4UKF5_9PEZI|nr:hypothetical protein K431DRAFT_299124 [Polychaeton citri CBS 116435]
MSKRRPYLNEPRFIRELPHKASTYLQAFTIAESNALKSIMYKVVDYTKALLTSAPTSRESRLFSVTGDDSRRFDGVELRRSARICTSYVPIGIGEGQREASPKEGKEEQDKEEDKYDELTTTRQPATATAVVTGTKLLCTYIDVTKTVLDRISAISDLESDLVARRQEYNVLIVDAYAELNNNRDICFNYLKILM